MSLSLFPALPTSCPATEWISKRYKRKQVYGRWLLLFSSSVCLGWVIVGHFWVLGRNSLLKGRWRYRRRIIDRKIPWGFKRGYNPEYVWREEILLPRNKKGHPHLWQHCHFDISYFNVPQNIFKKWHWRIHIHFYVYPISPHVICEVVIQKYLGF